MDGARSARGPRSCSGRPATGWACPPRPDPPTSGQPVRLRPTTPYMGMTAPLLSSAGPGRHSDPGLTDQVPGDAAEERPARMTGLLHCRRRPDQLAGGPAVGLEVVPAAGEVIPDPGDVGAGEG